MHDEAGFRDAREALDALEVDRQRVQRRARAASWWFYPGLSLMVALCVASPAIERADVGLDGYWLVLAVVGAVSGLGFLHRRLTGLAPRMQRDAASILTTAVMLSVMVGLYLASLVSERFGFAAITVLFPAIAFVTTLACCIALDRLGSMGTSRAR